MTQERASPGEPLLIKLDKIKNILPGLRQLLYAGAATSTAPTPLWWLYRSSRGSIRAGEEMIATLHFSVPPPPARIARISLTEMQ